VEVSENAFMHEILAIYRSCKKKVDINWFTEWLCRPVAALMVFFLRRTPITPNQVSFLSLFFAMGAGAVFACLPSYEALLLAAALSHTSFLLDCSDGMLARCKNIASHLGHLLDFLMDELKAMLLFACIALRLYQQHEDPLYLIVGMGFLFCIATGLTLTSFMRRPEYSGEHPTKDGQPAKIAVRQGPLGWGVMLLEHGARSVVHYPQYLWILAITNRLDLYFWGYGVVHVLYIGRAGLAIAWRLGRFERS